MYYNAKHNAEVLSLILYRCLEGQRLMLPLLLPVIGLCIYCEITGSVFNVYAKKPRSGALRL
jgi:hypothetical protein